MSDLSTLALIPHAIIHPDRIILYKEAKWDGKRITSKFLREAEDITVESQQATEVNQSKLAESFLKSARKNNGYMSTHAIRKMNRAIDYLLITSDKRRIFSKLQNKYINYHIIFATLTLPSIQVHTDQEITNKLLNQFFIELQKYHNVKKYIWRAEKQENGDIHYHILISEFIEYQLLRKRWNRICNKLGYVDSYQKKMKKFFEFGFRMSDNKNDKRTEEQQRKAYIIGQKSDWTSPNSTDIHDVRNIKDIKKYVTKYMQKNPDLPINAKEEEIEKMTVRGRLWSCSQNLSNITGCDLEESWDISDELETVVQNSKCKVYRDVYFSVIFVNALNLVKYGSELLFKYFSNYLLQTFDYNIQTKLKLA
jgi:hypothetical protein